MSSIHTTYRPRLDVAPEQTRDIRACAWAFVFACFEKHQQENKGGPVTAPDDAEESKNDRTAIAIIQED